MNSLRMARLLFVAVPFYASSQSDYTSVKHKFELIENERLRPGSKVTLSPQELNAYVREEVPKTVPEGVREPKVELGTGSATGSALVDFVKLRSAQGKAPGWLMRQLLAGEHPVTVVARIQSGGGRATAEVQSVEISGMTIEGRMLDFLIQNYLLPYYPDAKIGQPFELSHRMERLDIKPNQVAVYIK